MDVEAARFVNIHPNDLIGRCIFSLAGLTKALILSSSIEKQFADDIEYVYFWRTFRHKPSSIIEFANQIDTKPEQTDKAKALVIFGLYKEAFISLITFMKSQGEKDKIFRISYEHLTNQDLTEFDNARDLWTEGKYFEAASKIAQLVEDRLRETTFNVFSLLYGPYDRRIARLDDGIRSRMQINMNKDQKKNFSRAANELQYLDRKDYKGLLTGKASEHIDSKMGAQNWAEICSYIFQPWDDMKVYHYLSLFADFNTAIAHLKKDVIGIEQQAELLQFLISSMFFVQKLNAVYPSLLLSNYHFDNDNHYFSFHDLKDKNSLFAISINGTERAQIESKLKTLVEIDLPMHDREYLRTFFNLEYRKVMAIIASLVTNKQAAMSLSIIEHNGSLIKFRLVSM
jgi:hypothetical protein